MSKARVYGSMSGYVPNAQADRRRRPKLHEKRREIADFDRAEERRSRKEMQELEGMKRGGSAI